MNPKHAGFYIDLVKKIQGFKTDRQVATALGITAPRIVGYRNAEITLDTDTALDIADLAQCSVSEIIFMAKALKADNAGNSKAKLEWMRLARQAHKAARGPTKGIGGSETG